MHTLLLGLFLASTPGHPIALKAARLFDGKGDATVSPGLVIVRDGTIAALGPAAAIPPDAEVIDLGDATLLPGFIDLHTHISAQMSDDWKADELDALKKPPSQVALEATAFTRVTLMAGFTTVRDLGSSDQVDVGLREAIAKGVVQGPRLLVAVNALGAVGGHCDPAAGYRRDVLVQPGPDQGIATGPDEFRRAVRSVIRSGADVVKVCASGGVLSLTDAVDSAQLTQAELEAVADEAHALGRKVASHAHGAEAIKRSIRAGIDTIEHASFIDDEGLALAKAKGVALVFTPCLCMTERLAKSGAPKRVLEKARAASARTSDGFKRAMAKGVTLAFGSDSAVCPHGAQWEQLEWMGKMGMSPAAVLRSATSVASKVLGEGAERGTLEPGRAADIIAVAKDPVRELSRTREVLFVMKAGVVEKR